MKNKETREWEPFFLSNNQETPHPERHEHDGRSEEVHHLGWKTVPTGTTKLYSPS